jgi:hypothetical protein
MSVPRTHIREAGHIRPALNPLRPHPSRTYRIDHVFPRHKLRRDRLREAGYNEDKVERIVEQARDGLANLQLVDPDALRGYLEQHDMADLPEGLDGFLDFYHSRRERLRQRLIGVLGREPGSLIEEPSSPQTTPS